MRISFEEIYMDLAINISKRSTCERKSVGCVITSSDFSRVLSVGYNGNYKNGPNKCERPKESGNCGCLHAECNSLLKCNEGSEIKKIVFISLQPCVNCVKMIINKGGVEKVYYHEEYTYKEGVELLKSVGIEVEKL